MSQWVASTFLSSSFTQSSLIPSVFSFSGFSNHQLSLSTRCRSIQLSFPLGLMFCGQQSDFLITTNLVSQCGDPATMAVTHLKPSKTRSWDQCVKSNLTWPNLHLACKNSILIFSTIVNDFSWILTNFPDFHVVCLFFFCVAYCLLECHLLLRSSTLAEHLDFKGKSEERKTL